MIKNISRSRKEYQRAYQWLRWAKGSTDYCMFRDVGIETLDCAILSYDYHDSVFDGWINRHRQAKFLKLRYPAWTKEGLPF